MVKSTNVSLLITEFLVVGGIVYWILGIFSFLRVVWIRMVSAVIITIILGLIILKRENKKQNG